MDILKSARGHFKGSITRLFNYAKDIPEDVDFIEVEVRLERLENLWKNMCANQTAFYEYSAEEGYVDPEEDFVAVEDKYLAIKCALLNYLKRKPITCDESSRDDSLKQLVATQTELLQKLGETAPTTPSSDKKEKEKSVSSVELQPMHITPFSGDYRDWPGFRDIFLQTVDCNTKLSGAQKFRYLKSVLRGDAFNLLNNLNVSDSSYEQAWEKLERRYDKPLNIINALIEQFLKLPNVASGEEVNLRKLVDQADEVIRGLEAIASEGRDPWLVYLLINKTDPETRKSWALTNKNSDKSTIQELLDFLDQRASALETSDSKIRAPKVTRVSHTPKIKTLAVVKATCPKCKGDHFLPNCPDFLSMSIISRRGFARDQRLCYNCLGTKHSAVRCRVKTRCTFCNTRHHSLVHMDNFDPTPESSPALSSASPSAAVSAVSSPMLKESRVSGILPTVVVKVFDSAGNPHFARALLDTGSQVSFVTNHLAKHLGHRRSHARLPISGISSVEAGVTQGVIRLKLESRFCSHNVEVEAYILSKIVSDTPSISLDRANFALLEGLQLADEGFHVSGPIDLLLGADKVFGILKGGHRTDETGNLIAHESVFGWVVTGSLPGNSVLSLHAGVDVDVLLKSFWEIEEVHQNVAEDEVDAYFSKTLTRASDKRYMVELPFRQDKLRFANTLSGALSRLFAMERRFSRDAGLQSEYKKFMEAYLNLGHMERIPDDEVEPTTGAVFYLPHHAVVTNKIRVVFDGSHKDTRNVSLNETLHTGVPLQRNLFNVCVRFRLHRFVFCADIVKMFRQIWVHPKHRDFQRIVWRSSPNDPIAHYRLCTVTYGTSPAPYLSMKVLRQLAIDYQDRYPLASHAILHDMYVDDLLTGADSISEVLELQQQIVDVLACAGFELSKWSSNCWDILGKIDCKETISLDLDASQSTKVLGLIWNPYCDTFSYSISFADQVVPTKREFLSEVSKIFDPLGFLAPCTILFKILFQELWIAKPKMRWDDTLPLEVAKKWSTYRKDLPCFENARISRRCTRNSKWLEIIGFSDASEKAYSAVVYARSSSGNDVNIQLVAAKTRVAPVKQLSIPRLELCGALLLTRLINLVLSSLETTPVRTSVFCDSQIVLSWLSSPPRRWNTFVANRVAEILESLPRPCWNYVRSADNPADCASRGVEPTKLLDLDIWWNGPVWLKQEVSEWPSNRVIAVADIPEERKSWVAAMVSAPSPHFLEKLAINASSWGKLLRIVVFVRRAFHNYFALKANRIIGHISLSELRVATRDCLRWAQGEFMEDIHALMVDRCVPKGSKLASLAPFIDEAGLLRVGGRISNARNTPYSMKHPVILPKNHPITQLILKDAHRNFLHIGVSGLFALIRQKYWILGSRNIIRKLVHDCLTCFRLRQGTSSQLMGNLPSSRLDPSFAFAHTGCDYAGPITLRLSIGRRPKLIKGYIALFTCMTTKALHLEMVSDLTTDAFLAALKRFIARRGKCSIMYTDNGTNFKGAARVLSEMHRLVQSEQHNAKVAEILASEGIDWQFIPPHSPHFGGLWEAGVKLVKQHLRRVVGNNILTFEEMSTLLTQIEALLNSRPLCVLSDSDLNPLTPSHFLIGRPYTAVLEYNYLDTSLNRLNRWELVQNMVQGFWRRWHTDYLTSLQQRPKWKEAQRNFKAGDLVILKESNLPPSHWSLGRIEAVHPGQDGHVRVVTLRTKCGTFKRPVTKLAFLPLS